MDINRDEVNKKGEYTYRGRVYVRPVQRGVILEDIDGKVYLDELAALVGRGAMSADGDCFLEITIKRLPTPKD